MSKGQSSGGGIRSRGFASMSVEQQKAIASKGGKAAHAKGTAHEFNHEEAVAAGRKGGQSRRSTVQSRSDIGQKGVKR